MIPKELQLVSDISNLDELENSPTRNGFGEGLLKAGEDERVVVLCADLASSTRSHWFREQFPDRYVEIGVAEQNLATVGSGMAAYGKIPFITSYAAFSPGRNYEQIRTTIALNDQHVIVAGAHAGVSVGPDGATHQMLEDVSLMRALPNMTVIVPADKEEARKATLAARDLNGPVYIRLARAGTPVFTSGETPFEVGKAQTLWRPEKAETPEVAIVCSGSLTHNALLAAHELEKDGISVSVINNHTVKPMDEQAVIEAGREAGAVVTVEEHQVMGGMGGAVAEILSQNAPVPMEFIGVHDSFGQSGKPEELIKHYGMDSEAIIRAVHRARDRKANHE